MINRMDGYLNLPWGSFELSDLHKTHLPDRETAAIIKNIKALERDTHFGGPIFE